VFIFDKAPDSESSKKMMLLKYKILYGMGMSKRYQIEKEKYSTLQKMQVNVLKFMGKFFSAKKICSMWEKMVSKYSDEETQWRFASNYLLNEPCFYRSDIYQKDDEGSIRGRRFPIPGGYDEELTVHYGDYMNPPKDKDAFEKHAELED
jgi:phosphorylcholine metabolism protein LicD